MVLYKHAAKFKGKLPWRSVILIKLQRLVEITKNKGEFQNVLWY